MSFPLPPPRRRGKHAAPSKAAHAVPAVLLAMPVISGAGLAALDRPSSAAALTATPAAADTPTAAPVAQQQVPGSTRRTRAINEQTSASAEQAKAAARAARAAQAATAAKAKAAVPTQVNAPAASSPRSGADRASRSGRRSAWATPLAGRLTSSYGPRWGRQHAGIDVAAPTGVTIRAAASGKVIHAGWAGGYGNLVKIQHADGSVTAYGHMSRILVGDGYVRAGEVIGKVGSTGRSTGPHLHFEVRVADRPLNPISYLRNKGVEL